jgi:hypothetical protein
MEKDSRRFPKTGGWGYAVYNYDAAANKFSADPKALQDCGQPCHVAVKATCSIRTRSVEMYFPEKRGES